MSEFTQSFYILPVLEHERRATFKSMVRRIWRTRFPLPERDGRQLVLAHKNQLRALVESSRWKDGYEYAEANQLWNSAISANLVDELSLVASKCDAPRQVIRILESPDGLSSSLTRRLAAAFFHVGDFARGRELLRPELTRRKPDWRAHLLMGMAYVGQAEYEESFQHFSIAFDRSGQEKPNELTRGFQSVMRHLYRRSNRSSSKSQLVAIAKNERPYVLEWIAWHQLMGFEEITIYDNGSEDGTAETLASLDKMGIIEYVPWPDVFGRRPQWSAYEHALDRSAAEWVAFLDLDEFFLLKPDRRGVNEWLGSFKPETGQVLVNTRWFGSSGHSTAPEGLVTENFVKCAGPQNRVSRVTKHFVRRLSSARTDPHKGFLFPGYLSMNPSGSEFKFVDSNFEVAEIRHYAIKSEEEFKRKMKRGRATRAPEEDQHDRHTIGFFQKKNFDEDENFVEPELLEKVKARKRQLENKIAFGLKARC